MASYLAKCFVPLRLPQSSLCQDKFFRRKLHLQISLAGVIFFNLALFILGFLPETQTISILELICVNGMSIFYNLGIQAIFLVLPEMFPTQFKMIAMRLWSLVGQVVFLVHLLIFPIIMKKIGHYVFLMFLVSNGIFMLWVQFRHVESKDIPSMQVFQKFEHRKFV